MTSIRYRIAIVLLGLVCCPSLMAASIQQELDRARALLDAGDAAGAEQLYRELQVEAPESDLVVFGLGCAQYLSGEQHAAAQSPDLAFKSFDAARDSFNRVITSQNTRLRESAVYNHANCLAQQAKLIDPTQQYEEAVAALRQTVAAYEAILRDYPGHPETQQNLDHTRLLLKTLLQQPPEKQEQEDQEQQQPPPEQPPQVFSLFTEAATELPGARAIAVDNTARVLTLPQPEETAQ